MGDEKETNEGEIKDLADAFTRYRQENEDLRVTHRILRRDLQQQIESADEARATLKKEREEFDAQRRDLIMGPDFEVLWLSENGRCLGVPKTRLRREWIRSYVAHLLPEVARLTEDKKLDEIKIEEMARWAACLAHAAWDETEAELNELDESEG